MRYRRELQAKVSTFEIGWSFSFLFRCLSFSYCIEMLSKTRQTEKNRRKKKKNELLFFRIWRPPSGPGTPPVWYFSFASTERQGGESSGDDPRWSFVKMLHLFSFHFCFLLSLFFALLDSFSLPPILFSFVIFLKFKHSSSPCSTTQYPHSMIE